LGFNAPKKINDSILKNNWPKNSVDAEDDPHEAPVVAYNKEMDQLVEANTINSEVEEEDCETCPNGGMTKLNDEESTVFKTLCPKDLVTYEEEEGPTSNTKDKNGL
jgi:hypothetical protein